ncbi:MAG: DUF1638 domain-containing protein, partial [Spirochaetaceae bacterium]|nr:DUF1638 domain-containing protein [Spirochaetaceae bacterium]
MKPSDYRLVGCGILKDEIEQVLRERQWNMERVFLDSSLHVDLDKLAHGLGRILGNGEHRNIVCYGTCHPQMEVLMAKSGSRRTAVQNCVELILGSAAFNKHLADGAFFLFEDWALNWNRVTEPVFGTNPDN